MLLPCAKQGQIVREFVQQLDVGRLKEMLDAESVFLVHSFSTLRPQSWPK